MIIAPSGEIVAQASTTGDEVDRRRLRPRLAAATTRHAVRLRPLPDARALRPDHRASAASMPRRPAGPERQVSATDDRRPTSSPRSSTATAAGRGARPTTPTCSPALREELDVTSPKDGCSPSGQCGCCTVLLDGKADRRAARCRSTKVAEGKSVDHARGRRPPSATGYADAFAACGALQCGFCTPGHRRAGQGADRQEGRRRSPASDAARHLGAHLCRCTGYVKILDAIEAVAAGKRRRSPTSCRGGIGDAAASSTRAASWPSATAATSTTSACPGMLHAALRLTDHARADVRAHRRRSARWPRRASWPCSPPPTSRASCASASSTPTGRC